ncbi:MAG: hypothetical protein PVG53_02570 [Holophagae bacterium]|jgi:tetratricopeptide (TPR) repeat protein
MIRMSQRCCWLLLAVLTVAPSVSADQWYEHYARAEKALIKGDNQAAITELNLAIERRGDSGARVRTYGMRVTDYFPYLKLGIAYFAMGEYEAALRAFDTEEQLGAIRESPEASGELARFRRRATDARAEQRAARQRAVDELVEDNLTEARRLTGEDRLDAALAAVDRALALAPDNPEAAELADRLRASIVRRDDERRNRERSATLIAEGRRMRSAGRLGEAAARFRQAMVLDPAGDAADLLDDVQAELAAATDADAREAGSATLDRAEQLRDRGELEAALGLVQQVLASGVDDDRAGALEAELLTRISKTERSAEIDRLMADARDSLARGDVEAALADANLVLAKERGHAGALEVVREAYNRLSRQLLGDGRAQNLPPAIRFADLRREQPDGVLVQLVRDPALRLTGVIVDEGPVAVDVDLDGRPVTDVDLSEQVVGGVTVTEFRIDAELGTGRSVIGVEATDDRGLSSRGEYTVDHRSPPLRSSWLWATVVSIALVVVLIAVGRRIRRRRLLRRRRFNPYIAGPPVLDPKLFVGRDALVDRVLATVPNNSLLLLGERRIGKTSILQQLRLRLPELDHPRFCFVPAMVDLQGVPEEAFFAVVAEAVGEAISDDTMTGATSADGYDSRDLVRDLRRVLPTLTCSDLRRPKLVLLLDEIDELNGYSHRTNQRLRGLFMRSFADQLVAVAAGVGIARDWDHEGSPWYNFFEELDVGPLDPSAARKLVIEPIAGVLAVDDAAVEHLLATAGGRPYLIQKIALAAVQRAHEEGRGRITLDDVESAAAR